MGEQEKIKKFSESFFKNLKCELSWEGNSLIVKKIPKSFEEFYGKSGPYKIVFNSEDQGSGELMAKGSFLLKSMTDYLDTLGQTTLIKLNFERDYKEEFQRYLKLKGCEIHNIIKKADNQLIPRFTFLTTLQYLNEKEQFMNTICMEKGKITNFNLDKYQHSEGKKEDISTKEIKKDYQEAKNGLKDLLKIRIEKTSNILKIKLDKERERVKEHYKKQKKEIEDSIEKQKNQWVSFEKQLAHPNVKNPKVIQAKIDRLRESISNSQNSNELEKLNKEEEFFINDEAHKHSLNIHNKLMNTTLIYYPIFNFSITLKSKDAARQIPLTYDPYEDNLTKINCESCEREIIELTICSSGHVSCLNCVSGCKECGKSLCINCTKKMCEFCSRSFCKRCVSQCAKCKKLVCKNHTRKDYLTDKDCCIECLKKCYVCNQFTTQSHMNKTDSGFACKRCESHKSVKGIFRD